MVRLIVPPSHQPLKPGVYEAVLTGVEERTGQNGDYLQWSFEIAGTHGQVVKRPTSTSFGPQSNARKFVEAVLGRPLEVGEVIEADDLVGHACQVVIETATLPDGKQVNRVTAVLPAGDGAVPF